MQSVLLRRIQQAYSETFSIEHWSQAVAVTLTFKLALPGPVYAREEDYKQNVRHALNQVNRRLFGPRWRSKNRLEVLAVLERKDLRPHYHLAVNLPENVTIEAFGALIRAAWTNSMWG